MKPIDPTEALNQLKPQPFPLNHIYRWIKRPRWEKSPLAFYAFLFRLIMEAMVRDNQEKAEAKKHGYGLYLS